MTAHKISFSMRLAVAIVVCSLTIFASRYVLSSNLSAGLYPVEADSIGIPLAEVIITSCLCFVLMLASILIPKLVSPSKQWVKNTGDVLSIVSGVLAAMLAMDSVYVWFFPNHYLISLTHLTIASFCVYLTFEAIVRLRAH
jgi:hypothetical protein